jgi:hypothetical protein
LIQKQSLKTPAILIALILLGGAVLATLDGDGQWLRGWFAYVLLLGIGVSALAGAHRLVNADRAAMGAAAAAFLVRLVAGILLTSLLPAFGYPDNPVHQAGYVFYDAYQRDRAAWDLADSDTSLGTAFQGEYASDQYGGMLALSAAIYRSLSPDLHRPELILILTATFGALAVLFGWRATQDWFGDSTARPTAWILALYPETVLLGSSQMREVVIIAGVALAFYGLTDLQDGQIRRWRWLALAVLLLFFISPPAALTTLVFIFGLWALAPDRTSSWRQFGVFGGVLILGMVVVIVIFSQYPSLQRAGPWRVLLEWFQYNFEFQSHQLERASGWIQKLFDETGQALEPLIVLVYGVARPVLPAALVVPGNGVMRVIGILRSAGWYALAPLLLYSFWLALHPRRYPRGAQILWLSIGIWTSILVAALIAGGDQWDNPRYRTWLIVWAALLGAWGWWQARKQQDPWLGRILIIEGLFILLFTEWYISRYYKWFERLNFWVMVGTIVGFSGLVLLLGWWRDRKTGPISSNAPEEGLTRED